jgi:hypothetical protein
MRFLRPLLGITRWDHQRNPGIRNRFKVNNLIEDIKLSLSIEMVRLPGKNGQKSPKLAFQYQSQDDRMLEGSGGDRKLKNAFMFKGTDLKTYKIIFFT